MGATWDCLSRIDVAVVSIHAPVMGATSAYRDLWQWRSSFNPRPRDGGDLVHALLMHGGGDVSIHAPVMGATPRGHIVMGAEDVSIHAPVMGATPAPGILTPHPHVFQSTPP